MSSYAPGAAAYGEVAAALTPSAVRQYLAATPPWELESRQDQVKEIWALPGTREHPPGRILLPLDADYVDFPERFHEAVRAIGLINHWDATELEQHILAIRADLLFVRLEQVQADDTLPLKQAEATIDALYEMVKAAAITAATPGRAQRGGRLPSAVSAFLDDDVRLGHTRRGSFVFTVVTRLDAPSEHPRPAVADAGPVPRFPRLVMETLARGLETTRDLAERRPLPALEAPSRWGLSAGLLESVEDIAGPEGLRSLAFAFEWAAAEARPDVGTEPIRLEHAQVGELARVREQLLRNEEPPHRETLVGTVISLAREDEGLDSDEAGSVVLSAELAGRKRNVHMTLSGNDHVQAINAYRLKLPLIVTGDVVFERRAWRLTGDIDVDASIVERGMPPTQIVVPPRQARGEDPEVES
jgi:hypothetical protein